MVSLAIVINFLPVFLTTLQSDLGGLSNEQLGRVGGLTFLGLVVGILTTGPLADRFDSKACAVAGNVLIAIGLLALACCDGYEMLLASTFCMGLGAGVLDMVLSPIVAALRPDRRTAALNWLHSFYCVGAVAAVLACTLALQVGVSWRTVALGLIPFPVIVATAFIPLRIPSLIPDDVRRSGLGELLFQPVFLLALAAIFFAGSAELGLAQWLPAYAESTLGYSKTWAGASLLAFNAAMALGRMVAGSLAVRYSATNLMLAGCIASTLFFLVGCFSPWPSIALTGCILAGFTGSALWPSMLALTADWFPRGGATMFGVLAAFGNAGGIVMPWSVGAIADVSSMRIGLSTAAVCPVLMVFCLLAMVARRPNTVELPSQVNSPT